MEASAAGPEELHRAVGELVKARLGIVAVVEAPRDILGEKDRAPTSARTKSRQP